MLGSLAPSVDAVDQQVAGSFGGFFVLFPLTMGIGLVALVLPIMAMVAANRGEWYRYPLIFRFVKGPLDLETTERG